MKKRILALMTAIGISMGAPALAASLNLTVGDTTLAVRLEDNAATRALVSRLSRQNLTLVASDYGDFEKVAVLDAGLPTADEPVTTSPGDITLYGGRHLGFYYAVNHWSLTRIGHIQAASDREVSAFLRAGKGDIRLTLSLDSEPKKP